MLKKITICVIGVICVLVCSACKQRAPITVSFYDISGALSSDHTIKIMFAEEKDYEELCVDILLKSNKDTMLIVFKEFGEEKVSINLKAGETVSLDEYMIFNLSKEQTESLVGYGDVLTTTIVINSSANAKLTFKAVVGEKENNQFKQKHSISKEFELNVMAKNQNE